VLDVIYEDDVLSLVGSKNVRVAIWRDAPTLAQMKEVDRAARALARENPAGTGWVNLVVDGVPRFTQDVREEVGRLTRENTPNALANAHVILLDGFRGVAVRAFFSTVLLVTRSAVPFRAFGDIESASRWMAPLLAPSGVTWDAQSLAAVVAEARGRVTR
jgi:hypothetical protein